MKNNPRKILIAPLDWGLGHTTRCIPIIQVLLNRGHRITVALNKEQKAVLQAFFPTLTYVELDGYNIKYPVHAPMSLSMATQTAKILANIKKENLWLQNYVAKNPQDVIISDNRFGFYHPRIESIYITHQINIQGPTFLKPIFYSIHKSYIDNFHHCLIPDTEDSMLAGHLSKTTIDRFTYIGSLSRFTKEAKEVSIEYDYLAIISGPEPQRSAFCKMIETKFRKSKFRCAIIGGRPLDDNQYENDNLTYYPHLNTDEFYDVVCKSEVVISRSGYSTIMDFAVLQKAIFFVPTPGQTEQIFLANYHHKNSGVGFCKQRNFSLAKVVNGKTLPKVSAENTFESALKKLTQL